MIYESEEGLIGQGVPKQTKYWCAAVFATVLLFFAFIAYVFFIGPFYFNVPINPKFGGVLFEVQDGSGVVTIGKDLKSAGIIASSEAFNLIAEISGDTKKIKPGFYLFKKPAGALEAESRISKGDFGLPIVKLTFPEGFTTKQIAERLDANLVSFDKAAFMDLASTSQGYLFPDTYFILPNDSGKSIYKKMISVFDQKTAGIFATSTKSKKDIIKMASILEKEVRSPEDMRIVSGILWKRIKIGMALQVDSSPETYERPGLSDSPVSNPGLNAILAAVNPVPSSYLYFLTDKAGKVYYAKTFEEHKQNKAKYLGK
ncbi:MAG: endolytic transglycosylase MltG [Patescibacteria group bacterium]